MPLVSSLKHRVLVASIHLCASVPVATAVSLMVFKLWYPPPFAAISGGLTLFVLLIGVDIALGPALTAVVASPGKPRKKFACDLAVIFCVQVAALTYGVYSLALGRPVALVFELDRMRVVSAADIEPILLRRAPPQFRELSWSGPRLMAALKPTDPTEQLQSMDLGLSGIDLGMDPRNWVEYDAQRANVVKAARPVSLLLARYPKAAGEVGRMAANVGQSTTDLRFLPLQARHAAWTTLVSSDGKVVGHLPIDGFL